MESLSEYDLIFPLYFLPRPGPQHIPLGTDVSREPLAFPGRLCLGRSLPTAGIFLACPPPLPESLRGGEAGKSSSLESSLWGPARVPWLRRHHLKGMWGPDKRLPLSHFLFARTSRPESAGRPAPPQGAKASPRGPKQGWWGAAARTHPTSPTQLEKSCPGATPPGKAGIFLQGLSAEATGVETGAELGCGLVFSL